MKFSADQNFLNGNLQNLRNLTALIELSLSNNMFTSTIPSFFRNMTRMNYTDLSSNMLVGTIPSDLFIDMVNLSSLILNSNNFVGTIPYELPQNISDIDVSDNAFVGQIPETIFRLPDLNQLSASKNCISLNLPASICEAQSLRYLYISGLQQSHKCSQEILALGESYVTIPPCFWSSLDLQELIVAGNAFSGHMESFDMPNITKLDVSYNRLHGTIPAQVFNGKKMTEFQVSNNMFTGTLDFSIVPASESDVDSTYAASVNRISGPLHTSSLNKFEDVEVVKGNIISCSTIPSESVDPSVNHYVCASSNYRYSIYIWLTLAGILVFTVIFCYFSKDHRIVALADRLKDIISVVDLMCSDDAKNRYAFTIQLLESLMKLCSASIVLTVMGIVIAIIIYSSFKYGPESSQFRTHYYQYLYNMSGVYLKSPSPASVLMIIHTVFAGWMIYVFYQFFVVDWSNARYFQIREERKRSGEDSRQSHWSPNQSTSFDDESRGTSSMVRMSILKNQDYRKFWFNKLYIFFCCILFIVVAIAGNAAYISVYEMLSSIQLIFVQFAVLIFNGIMKNLGVTLLVEHAFRLKDLRKHSGTSTLVVSALLASMEILVPTLATIFSDPLCFYNAVYPNQALQIEQTTTSCYQYKVSIYNGSDDDYFDKPMTIDGYNFTLYGHHLYCSNSSISSRSVEIQPDFVYSGQCRNALIRNFLPLVIIQSAFDGFIIPIFYYFITTRVTCLNTPLTVSGSWLRLKITDVKRLVITSPTFAVAKIWQAMLMQLTFGLFSPVASFAIGVSIVSRIILLRCRICQYFRLQDNSGPQIVGVTDRTEYDVNNPDNIEYITSNTSQVIHAMIWPGLIQSTLLFSLYVFDMAYDVDNPSMAVSLTLLILTLLTIPVTLLLYYNRRNRLNNTIHKIRADSETEITTLSQKVDDAAVVKDAAVKEGSGGFDMTATFVAQVEEESVKNPILELEEKKDKNMGELDDNYNYGGTN